MQDHARRFDYVFVGDLLDLLKFRASSLDTKQARARYFLRSSLGFRSIERLADRSDWFRQRSLGIVNQIVRAMELASGYSPTRPRMARPALVEAVERDMDEIERWTRNSEFEFVGSVEEFFNCALKVRFLHGDQLRQISASGAEAAAIVSTAWLAEEATAVSLLDKLNYKLRHRVIRLSPHAALRKTPSVEAPWISADWPNPVKNLVKGVRSVVDGSLALRYSRAGSRETVFRQFPMYSELMETVDKVRSYPNQESYEMKSWLRWLEEIRLGRRRATSPKRFLNMAAVMRILDHADGR